MAARQLARLGGDERRRAVLALAGALEHHARTIVAANQDDLAAAGRIHLEPALLQRLKLDAIKLESVITGVRQVADLPDPVGHVSLATELDDGLVLERVACPIGVIAVIFESRPDVLPQIAALSLKSGNAVLLKGGREAERTNAALHAAVRASLADAGLPDDAVTLLQSREDIAALLTLDHDVDLVIPRGSAGLVRHIQANTRIPVLGHADGLCHLYVDAAADLDMALALAVDAKTEYPAACNAIETLLLHERIAPAFLPRVASALTARGVELLEGAEHWDTEHSALRLTVRVVDSLDAALEHIARHGSRHTEAIVTRDEATAARFCAEVDAAGVFVNASTRFADGFRYGFGAEVGISTGRLHPRGPVGLEGLVTYKYRLHGHGHTVAPYVGPDARPFTHRPLST